MWDFGEEEKEIGEEGRVRVPMGRGKNLGEGRGSSQNYNNNNTSRPKFVRRRGPQPSSHNNAFEDLQQSRRPAKPMEKTSHGRATAASESAPVGFRKNVVASNLNSASLFCPSGSSNKEANSTQDLGPRPSVMAENSQSNFAGGKENVSAVVLGMDKLCITDSISKPQIYLPPHRRNLQPSRQPLFVTQSASAPKTSHALESMDLMKSSTHSNASTTALPLAGKGNSCISGGGMTLTLDAANHNAPPSAQPKYVRTHARTTLFVIYAESYFTDFTTCLLFISFVHYYCCCCYYYFFLICCKRIVLRGYVHGLVWSDDELSVSNPSDEEQEPISEDEIDAWIPSLQKRPRDDQYLYRRREPDPYEDDPTHPDARRGWVH